MHHIEMHEPTQEFLRCWQAAVSHLHRQVDGGIQSWLKVDPTPPWLEHLSFRLGNQLFFVRIVDVDAKLEITGNDRGVHLVAEKCGGHACIMPMKKKFFDGDWTPTESGWGLLDAITKKPINPIDFVTDEEIEITDWELNDIAVLVVRTTLQKEGYQLMNWVSNPALDPAIWFVGKSKQPEWIVVRAARYPIRKAKHPSNLAEIAKGCADTGTTGHFASVAVANADDPFDPMAKDNGNFIPIFRGHKLLIRYQGLEPVLLDANGYLSSD
jgi:hypothetical protein